MKIGIIIGRIGGIDGVALETEKWIAVLERMGHEVRVLAGALEGPVQNVTVLPDLAFSNEAALKHQEIAFHAYFGLVPFREQDEILTKKIAEGEYVLGRERELIALNTSEAALLKQLDEGAEYIANNIESWLSENSIDLLISENASAIPLHLTMGMAVKRVLERTKIAGVTHDHDFYWERGDRYESPFEGVRTILAECFPINLPNVRHAVINRAARHTLEERFGITDTIVIPNVMDFDAPIGQPDDYNRELRQDLGLSKDDILLFQVTRIVLRKRIDTAIELVHRLDNPRVKLIITGTTDEPRDTYLYVLRENTKRLGLEDQILFASERFDNFRRTTPSGDRVYSLWDAYANATACTYFSLYEGFGNAFVEAVVAKVPIFVNNYEPVYWPDIGSKGFRTVMIEGGKLTDDAVSEVRQVLDDAVMRQEIAEHNFELGRRHFSYQALEGLLEELLGTTSEGKREC